MPHSIRNTARNEFIDMLRGISMAAVISLHTLANYLSSKTIVTLWDVQQFAVQLFVFCSAYLFFSRPEAFDRHTFVAYFKKRLVRLYRPYLIYVVVFLAVAFILQPAQYNINALLKAVMVTKTIDIHWLVTLFTQFIFLFPLIQYLYLKKRPLFYLYALIATASTIVLFFVSVPQYWDVIMWLPWSFIALYAIFYIRFEEDRETIRASYLLFVAVFVVFECIQYIMKSRLYVYPNKYPPNMLLLSYGIIWLWIMQWLYKEDFFRAIHAVPLISFLSRYSFSLFFIHYVVLFIMNNYHLNALLPWYFYWIVLFSSTLFLQKVLLLIYPLMAAFLRKAVGPFRAAS